MVGAQLNARSLDGGRVPMKDDERVLSEVEGIIRRFLAGELPLEEAARDIANVFPSATGSAWR